MALPSFKTQADIQGPTDSVGGGFLLESGIHTAVIDMAYLDMSKGGAYSLNLTFKTEDGKTLREQLWMTGGTDKGQLNYYLDKDGKKQYLPGFNIANAIAVLTVGKEIGDLEPEDKMVNIRNFELKKDVPTAKPVYTDLIGQQVALGVIKQIVAKNVKQADGSYAPGAETRTENVIDAVFSVTTAQTLNEHRDGIDPVFAEKWSEANTGKTRDRTKKAGGTATAGQPAAPTKSLFGNK